MSITVKCPICSKSGMIRLSDEMAIRNSDRGITSILIQSNEICKHSFIVYIDKNLKIRDYLMPDYTINLPEMNINAKSVEDVDFSFDLDIIKINLLPNILISILTAIFNGVDILFISDQLNLNNHYQKFFKNILKDSFNHNLIFLDPQEYILKKKNFKNNLIIDRYKVITKNKNISELPKKIETKIVQDFFQTYDNLNSIILLKNEILKLYLLSKKISEYISENNRADIYNLLTRAENEFKMKLPRQYWELIIKICENYFQSHILRKNVGIDLFWKTT